MATTSILDSLRVASPCPIPWEGMASDEWSRYCPQCRQHVFNISGMARQEAEVLLQERQGRVCVRYYQRADGTVMTRDCSPGVRRTLWRGMALTLLLALTMLAVLFTWARSGSVPADRVRWHLRDREPFRAIFEWFDPAPPRELLGKR
jgi:hypothetical protein